MVQMELAQQLVVQRLEMEQTVAVVDWLAMAWNELVEMEQQELAAEIVPVAYHIAAAVVGMVDAVVG